MGVVPVPPLGASGGGGMEVWGAPGAPTVERGWEVGWG